MTGSSGCTLVFCPCVSSAASQAIPSFKFSLSLENLKLRLELQVKWCKVCTKKPQEKPDMSACMWKVLNHTILQYSCCWKFELLAHSCFAHYWQNLLDFRPTVEYWSQILNLFLPIFWMLASLSCFVLISILNSWQFNIIWIYNLAFTYFSASLYAFFLKACIPLFPCTPLLSSMLLLARWW